jgi:Uncharacterized low-complexity proteins
MTKSAIDQKPAVKNLEAIAMRADFLESDARIRDKNGVEYTLHIQRNKWMVQGYVLEAGARFPDMYNPDNTPNEELPFHKRYYRGPGAGQTWGNDGPPIYTFSEAMLHLSTGLPEATLIVESIKAKSTNSELKGAPLKQAAVAAWCEAFGIAIPSAKELKASKASNKNITDENRKKLTDQLRSGESGIKAWNSLSLSERTAHDLNNLDLSGADLTNLDLSRKEFTGANFSSADFSGADFTRVVLKKCNFENATIQDANFERAIVVECNFTNADFNKTDAKGAWFSKSKLNNAHFKKTDLERANFEGTDMTGCNFTDCNFKDAPFDRHTIFPENFDEWDEMIFNGSGIDPRKLKGFNESHSTAELDFDKFFERLKQGLDKDRIKKSVSMLKKEKFQLFFEVTDNSVTGVVKSQTDPDLAYSCRLTSDGNFSCCTQNLFPCGGLRGALCKHILVLVLGLTRAGELDPNKADLWARASALQQPKLDKDIMSQTFLRFKGAEAGEVDWRPTATTPEDFYAF